MGFFAHLNQNHMLRPTSKHHIYIQYSYCIPKPLCHRGLSLSRAGLDCLKIEEFQFQYHSQFQANSDVLPLGFPSKHI